MHEKFIARQPIFDRLLRVFAYELLFRSGPQNEYRPVRGGSTGVLTDSITLFDLQMLTGNARAFINVDEAALRLGAARLLPPERIVVEILESVRPTEEIIAICRDLRADGYQLALDDFIDPPGMDPLIELASFLKVDYKLLAPEDRARLAHKYSRNGLALLAEKVESRQELDEAQRLGYNYFQGYFFCKPSVLEAREIPGNRAVQLQLLNAASAAELDYGAIEELFKQDPSLLYRLLRYLNSPLFGRRHEVRSVKHALALMGEQDFRRWISIFALLAMSNGKPPELVRTALVRAYFCEGFSGAAHMPESSADLFFMGLLSVCDALLDKPIREVLISLPVAEEIKTALCGGENRMRDVYDAVLAWERGEWPRLPEVAERLGCDEQNVPEAYRLALEKASAISI
jgi:c-di-GMP-related signal transduction protein